MICYKAVCVTPDDNVYTSVNCQNARLEYVLGKKTVPEFGKIFVFKELEDARRFLSGNSSNYRILECKCNKNMKPIYRRLSSLASIDVMKRWWNNEFKNDFDYAPTGTYGADWVIPFSEVA